MKKRELTESEHAIQNRIRNHVAGRALMFRANVGTGWQGDGKPFSVTRTMVVTMHPGDVLLRNGRPFSTGLPPGFADTFGGVQTTITPDMIGKTICQFFGLEIKDEYGKPSAEQANFLAAVRANGGRAGIARSTDDAEWILWGDHDLPNAD